MDHILIDIGFCLIFVSVPFLTVVLLPYAGISLRKFSLPSLFVIFYLALAYVGILPLYFQWDPNAVALYVTDKRIILMTLLYSGAALLVTLGGFIFAHQVIGFGKASPEYDAPLGANRKQRVFALALLLLCIVVLVEYIRKVDSIALFKALSGDLGGALEARSNMTNAFEGTYWHFRIFFRTLLDYCVIFFLADYIIRKRRSSCFLFLVSFIVASFSATMAIEKGPFIFLLILLYLTFVTCRGGNYWQSGAKYLMVAVLTSSTAFYIYFAGQKEILALFGGILRRVFVGQISPVYFYLHLFPRHIDYLLGASLPNPGGVLPFHNYQLTKEVANFMTPESFAAGIVGSAPTVYWAEMYANFGPSGIIFSSFLVGIILFAVSNILSRLRLSPPLIAATLSLAAHYAKLSGTSLSNYFFDTTMIAIATVTGIAVLLDRRISPIRVITPFAKLRDVNSHEE